WTRSALPVSLVEHCGSPRREYVTHVTELQKGLFNPFTMSPVTTTHARVYGCSRTCNHIPLVWPGHSKSLEIMVTGICKKTLSAQVGPVMMSGQNLTLFCESVNYLAWTINLERESQSVNTGSLEGSILVHLPSGPYNPSPQQDL
ncbi:hypothetical protein HPG69_013868, partial [Diceros bicornis minor]